MIQQPVIDLASEMDPESLKKRVSSLLKPAMMKEHISAIWVKTGSLFAVDMMKRMERMPKKQEEDVDYWEDYYRRYTRERTAAITGEIMDTQTIVVNRIIDELLEEGTDRGLGIPEIQRRMRQDLLEGLTEINKYQAERIARTEVIGASNTGSFDGAKASGLDMKKAWLTSGLPGVRQTHQDYESMGPVEMDYEFSTGLQYPGDPEGDPEEIINCRCTIIYEVD